MKTALSSTVAPRYSILLLLFMLAYASAAGATDSPVTTVIKVKVCSTCAVPKAQIDLTSDSSGKPACHTSAQWDYLIDITGSAGQSALAALLGAQLAGRSVKVYGTASCLSATTIEQADSIEVN